MTSGIGGWRLGLALLGALAAVACGSKATPENFGRISTGMTRAEVYDILGQPDQVSGGGIGGLQLASESWKGDDHTVLISFAGEKVAIKSIEPTDR